MTEKESLLVLIQEIKSDLSFCRDCAVSQGATGWVKDFDRLLDKNEILNNKLNQQFSSRSKLSIPKKIADKLDNDDANSKAVLDWVFATEMIEVNNEKALEKREDEILKRRAIVSIYGASKALGIDLVEVTDDK